MLDLFLYFSTLTLAILYSFGKEGAYFGATSFMT